MSEPLSPEEGGAPASPPSRARYVPFRAVRPGTRIVGWAVNPSAVYVFSHWLGAGRARCAGGPDRCCWCHLGRERRWSAFLAVAVDNQWQRLPVAERAGRDCRPVIVEVTQGAVDYCHYSNCRAPWQDLRGIAVKLERQGRLPNAPMKLYFAESEAPFELPAPIDLADYVRRRWPLAPPPDIV